MDVTETKYQKARYIASETMCTNLDIYLIYTFLNVFASVTNIVHTCSVLCG